MSSEEWPDENAPEAERMPRFKLKVQDDVTGVVMAVGTDDIKAFQTTDLKKFLRQFRANVTELERSDMHLGLEEIVDQRPATDDEIAQAENGGLQDA